MREGEEGTEMNSSANIQEGWRNRQFGLRSTMIIAISFLLIGMGVATGLSWTRSSEAERLYQPASTSGVSTATSSSFADLAARLAPAVVNIKVTRIERAAAEIPTPPNLPFDEESPFNQFFGRFSKKRPRGEFRSQGAGSGFIISPEGYILTNSHVVDQSKEVIVTLAGKDEYQAKVVGRDSKTDIAVLKIEPKKALTAVPFGDSDRLRVGDWVLAVGNPFGLNNTVTAGIVSAKGRVIGAGPYDDFIQTDASINPGNSGGPLFNLQGEVVGINTAIDARGQGIGFAIPINIAKSLVPQLETKGEVTRSWLGVSIQSISPEIQKAMELADRNGALVADVVKGSPAEKAGVQRGDLIVSYDDQPVTGADMLPAMVAKTPINKVVTLVVLRNQERETLSLTTGKMPNGEVARAETGEPSRPRWGLALQNLTPEVAERLGVGIDSGVLVADVESGSPANVAGIQRGDLIQEINRKKVTSVDEVQRVISAARDPNSLLLLVKRKGTSIFAALEAK